MNDSTLPCGPRAGGILFLLGSPPFHAGGFGDYRCGGRAIIRVGHWSCDGREQLGDRARDMGFDKARVGSKRSGKYVPERVLTKT